MEPTNLRGLGKFWMSQRYIAAPAASVEVEEKEEGQEEKKKKKKRRGGRCELECFFGRDQTLGC